MASSPLSLLALLRDEWSAPFFDAAARGQLMLLRCNMCQEYSSPQARRCAVCSSDRIEWVKSDGRGCVVTWTVPHKRGPATSEPAYVLAIVELREGPWIHAAGPPALVLHAGQEVTIGFVAVAGGESLPVLDVDV